MQVKQAGDGEGGGGRGDGGVIALTRAGEAALTSNSAGMTKAFATAQGELHVLIYDTECPREASKP
jgi:hypothetical protein